MAYDADDAVKTLRETVSKPIIKSVSTEGMVHDISTRCFETIKSSKLKKDSKETQVINPTPVEDIYRCPWCEKTYNDPKYLKIHLNKAHNVKELQV